MYRFYNNVFNCLCMCWISQVGVHYKFLDEGLFDSKLVLELSLKR